nr:hypothetical protein CFP56_14156 [Quercus suber]
MTDPTPWVCHLWNPKAERMREWEELLRFRIQLPNQEPRPCHHRVTTIGPPHNPPNHILIDPLQRGLLRRHDMRLRLRQPDGDLEAVIICNLLHQAPLSTSTARWNWSSCSP